MAEAEGQDYNGAIKAAGSKCWHTANKWWHKARGQTGIPHTKVVLETGILRREEKQMEDDGPLQVEERGRRAPGWGTLPCEMQRRVTMIIDQQGKDELVIVKLGKRYEETCIANVV